MCLQTSGLCNRNMPCNSALTLKFLSYLNPLRVMMSTVTKPLDTDLMSACMQLYLACVAVKHTTSLENSQRKHYGQYLNLHGNIANNTGQQVCAPQRCMHALWAPSAKRGSYILACTSPATCFALLCSNEGMVNMQSTACSCEKRFLPPQLITAPRATHYSLAATSAACGALLTLTGVRYMRVD